MDNWKTYPLYKPLDSKVYITTDINGNEHRLLFKDNLWYELNGRLTINTPIRFKDEN